MCIHKGIEEHRKICKILSTLNSEQYAAIGMMIEELNPGFFTRKDEITITINTKEITLDDYIQKMLPDVNLIKAKELYKNTRKKEEIHKCEKVDI